MPTCADSIFNLSTGLWEAMGSPTSISTASISGKLMSSGVLGKFNNDVNGCFFVDSGVCISPEMDSEQQGLYAQMYLLGFYQQQAAQAVGNPALLYTAISEGDTSIRRDSSVSLAKFYASLQAQAYQQYKIALGDYRRNHSMTRDISYLNPPRHPTDRFGGAYGGYGGLRY